MNDEGALNVRWGHWIAEGLACAGVETVCVSPGARSAPLAVAVRRHPRLHCVVHYDERGAAFFALGTALRQGKPAALVCTSGTAGVNYMPAIVEASYHHVPLVALTADRPPEHINVGANQTIDQSNLYGSFVRSHLSLPCPTEVLEEPFVQRRVIQAVNRSCTPRPGPVHINCPFREPLLGKCSLPSSSECADTPNTVKHKIRLSPADEDIQAFVGAVAKGPGIIVAGGLRNPNEAAAIEELAEHLGWPLLPDIASGLRFKGDSPVVIPHVDLLMGFLEFAEKLDGHTVLHVGNRITSKRLLQYLQAYPPDRHFQVTSHGDPVEPWFAETRFIQADPSVFCRDARAAISNSTIHESNELTSLKEASNYIALYIENAFTWDAPLTEPYVCRRIAAQPDIDSIFVGNSMPIRNMDAFAGSRDTPIRIYANRGASGIDGSIATFAGIAAAADGPCMAVIGDMAALHDLNSLGLLHHAPCPPTIVVINNNGGGIFHFLPLDSANDVFEDCFGTPHGMNFEAATRQFDLVYHAPDNAVELDDILKAPPTKPTLVEITTDRKSNRQFQDKLLTQLHTFIYDIR